MTFINVIHRQPQDFQRALPVEQLLEICDKTLGNMTFTPFQKRPFCPTMSS